MQRKKLQSLLRLTCTLLVMAAGTYAAPIQYSVNIQPIYTPGVSSAPFSQHMAFADAIFGQAGIDVRNLSPVSSSLSSNVNNNYYNYQYASAPRTINVWFVNTIAGGQYRGYSTTGNVFIANNYAWDTLAHEIAHLLTAFSAIHDEHTADHAHSTDPYNLLAGGAIRYTPTSLGQVGSISQISAQQALVMQHSVYSNLLVYTFGEDLFVAEVPEPSTLAITGLVLIAAGLVQRRRSQKV